jgi:shikimate kinase
MAGAARSIVLIGFMGTGKSEVGRILARTLEWKLFDTDLMVEEVFGMPIAEIFTQFGEARFRQEESAALASIALNRPSIIVTGGGAVLRPENVARMRELGPVVCLTTDPTTLEQRLADRNDRPLLSRENRAETIRILLREREPHYRKAARQTFDTSELGSGEVATLILRSLALSH